MSQKSYGEPYYGDIGEPYYGGSDKDPYDLTGMTVGPYKAPTPPAPPKWIPNQEWGRMGEGKYEPADINLPYEIHDTLPFDYAKRLGPADSTGSKPKEPEWFDPIVTNSLNIAGPVLGGIIGTGVGGAGGTAVEPGGGTIAGGVAGERIGQTLGAAAGSTASQLYEKWRGLRESMDPIDIGINTAVAGGASFLPRMKVPGLGSSSSEWTKHIAKATGRGMFEGTGINLASTPISSYLHTGELPSWEQEWESGKQGGIAGGLLGFGGGLWNATRPDSLLGRPAQLRSGSPNPSTPPIVTPPTPHDTTAMLGPETVEIRDASQELPVWRSRGYVSIPGHVGPNGGPIVFRPDIAAVLRAEPTLGGASVQNARTNPQTGQTIIPGVTPGAQSTIPPPSQPQGLSGPDTGRIVVGQDFSIPVVGLTDDVRMSFEDEGYILHNVTPDGQANFRYVGSPDISGERGSINMDLLVPKFLRKLLGREPTEAEVAAETEKRAVQPGETTGRVAPFTDRRIPQQPTNEVADIARRWAESILGANPDTGAAEPPLTPEELGPQYLHQLGPRPVGPGDAQMQGPQQGQQDLPLLGRTPTPQLDIPTEVTPTNDVSGLRQGGLFGDERGSMNLWGGGIGPRKELGWGKRPEELPEMGPPREYGMEELAPRPPIRLPETNPEPTEPPWQRAIGLRPASGFKINDILEFLGDPTQIRATNDLTHDYARGQLSGIPHGKPGVEVKPSPFSSTGAGANPAIDPGTFEVIVRNSQGEPVVHADFSRYTRGSKATVNTLGASKGEGLAYGDEVLETLKTLFANNATKRSGSISPHTANMLKKVMMFADDISMEQLAEIKAGKRPSNTSWNPIPATSDEILRIAGDPHTSTSQIRDLLQQHQPSLDMLQNALRSVDENIAALRNTDPANMSDEILRGLAQREVQRTNLQQAIDMHSSIVSSDPATLTNEQIQEALNRPGISDSEFNRLDEELDRRAQHGNIPFEPPVPQSTLDAARFSRMTTDELRREAHRTIQRYGENSPEVNTIMRHFNERIGLNTTPQEQGTWEVFDPRDGITTQRFNTEEEAISYTNENPGYDYARQGQGYMGSAHGNVRERPVDLPGRTVGERLTEASRRMREERAARNASNRPIEQLSTQELRDGVAHLERTAPDNSWTRSLRRVLDEREAIPPPSASTRTESVPVSEAVRNWMSERFETNDINELDGYQNELVNNYRRRLNEIADQDGYVTPDNIAHARQQLSYDTIERTIQEQSVDRNGQPFPPSSQYHEGQFRAELIARSPTREGEMSVDHLLNLGGQESLAHVDDMSEHEVQRVIRDHSIDGNIIDPVKIAVDRGRGGYGAGKYIVESNFEVLEAARRLGVDTVPVKVIGRGGRSILGNFIFDETGSLTIPGRDKIKAGLKKADKWMFGRGENNEPSIFEEAIALPTAATTTGDLSIPGRQGLPLITTPQFWKALGPMFKAGASDAYTRQIDAEIKSSPIHQRALNPRTGRPLPSIADDMNIKLIEGGHVSRSEHDLTSSWVETGGSIPYASALYRKSLGQVAKMSNRAAATFLNHIRTSTAEKFLASAHALANEAFTTGEARPNIFKQKFTQDEAKMLNPYDNKVLLREMGDFINTATGRGPLKTHILTKELDLEWAAKGLRFALFSPRNMASRIRMMNPSTYMMATPQVRKQYLLAMLGTTAGWATMVGLAKGAGAITGTDVQVGTDSNSADFGKIRIGDFRMDPSGGFLPYLVQYSRAWNGQWTSSANQQEHEFGQGFRAETQGSTAQRFMTNKLNPIAKYAWDVAWATDYQPFHVGDRTMQMYIPLVYQDMWEIARDNPKLLPFTLAPVMFGAGTQIYDKGESVSKFISPENDWLSAGGGIKDLIPFYNNQPTQKRPF